MNKIFGANEQSSSSNRVFYILLAVSSLLLVLLFGLLNKIASLTLDHVLYKCKEAVTGFSLTLPHLFPPLFTFSLLFVILTGLFIMIYQILRTKIFISKLLKNKVATPVKIKAIISELGIAGQVTIVKNNNLLSFCYGLVLPKICLSTTLVASLIDNELKAVLVHEMYHLKNRDPLKMLLGKVAVSMFFFVPTLKDFYNYYALSKEINADQLAVKTKLTQALKSALIKILGNFNPSVMGVASFGNEVHLEQRIKTLTISNYKTTVKISLLKMGFSVAVFAVAFSLLSLPVHAMENDDGTHSYVILRSEHTYMLSCELENMTKNTTFSSQTLFSPFNYSSNH